MAPVRQDGVGRTSRAGCGVDSSGWRARVLGQVVDPPILNPVFFFFPLFFFFLFFFFFFFPSFFPQVIDLANVISRPQHTVYGETFDVVVEESPINVAYSSLGLPLHQDLVYYESPPGLQMLHCLKFAGEVDGGESTLLDG